MNSNEIARIAKMVKVAHPTMTANQVLAVVTAMQGVGFVVSRESVG